MNFTSIIIGAVVAFILSVILKQNKNTPPFKLDDGTEQLRTHISMQIIGYIVLFSGVIITLVFTLLLKSENGLLMTLPITILISSVAVYFIIIGRRHKVYFTKDKVQHFSYTGEKTEFYWYEIKNISYSKFKGAHILEVRGKKLKLSDFLNGTDEFLALAHLKSQAAF